MLSKTYFTLYMNGLQNIFDNNYSINISLLLIKNRF